MNGTRVICGMEFFIGHWDAVAKFIQNNLKMVKPSKNQICRPFSLQPHSAVANFRRISDFTAYFCARVAVLVRKMPRSSFKTCVFGFTGT